MPCNEEIVGRERQFPMRVAQFQGEIPKQSPSLASPLNNITPHAVHHGIDFRQWIGLSGRNPLDIGPFSFVGAFKDLAGQLLFACKMEIEVPSLNS